MTEHIQHLISYIWNTFIIHVFLPLSALMDGWMGLLEQRAWPLRLLFFEDDDARHAETLLSLTSGQRRCNLTAPNPEAPLAGDPFPFIYFFCWCAFPPAKKITALLIKCWSCRKVTVIPAPDKATHRDLGALKPADKAASGGRIGEKDKREGKE